jgi:hypothetical protein
MAEQTFVGSRIKRSRTTFSWTRTRSTENQRDIAYCNSCELSFEGNKKREAPCDASLRFSNYAVLNYLLNLLLRIPTPARPAPRKRRIDGSGTDFVPVICIRYISLEQVYPPSSPTTGQNG